MTTDSDGSQINERKVSNSLYHSVAPETQRWAVCVSSANPARKPNKWNLSDRIIIQSIWRWHTQPPPPRQNKHIGLFVCQHTNFKSGKCIRGDVEGGHLHVSEEIVELLRAEGDLCQRLMPYTFPQHDPAVQSDVWRLVTAKKTGTFGHHIHILMLF